MAGTLVISTLSDGTNSTSSTNCIQGSAKAWVMFNGFGVATNIKSYNVGSLTFLSTGNYTVNFSTALADANYCIVGAAGNSDNASRYVVLTTARTTTAFNLKTYNGGNSNDNSSIIGVAVFD